MKRMMRDSDLKPEKVDEYIRIHANPWPELLELIAECNIHNYSISINGTRLLTYFEYTGEDYEADMKKMDASDIQKKWCESTKPCFLHHEEGWYYEDFTEVFYTK